MKTRARLWSGRQTGRAALIVVVILVVVVGAAAAWWFLVRSTPEKTVEAYVAAVEEGNEAKILALMTNETAELMTQLKQQVESQFGPMPAQQAGPGMGTQMGEGIESIGKAKIKGDRATVSVKMKPITMGDMEIPGFEQEIKLAKEGGKWKIDMAQELKASAKIMGMMAGGKMESALKEMAEGFAEGFKGAMGEGTGPMITADADSLVAEGMAAKRAGKLDEAVSKFQQALDQDPNSVDAHWGIAWALASQKKNQEAIAHFEQVLQLTDDPDKTREAKAAVDRLKQQT